MHILYPGGPCDAREGFCSVQEWDWDGKSPERLRAEEGRLWYRGQHQEGRVRNGLSATGTHTRANPALRTANPGFQRCHFHSHHQVAKTKQRIEEEKMQVQVVERTQQIMLQEQEIIRKEKELEAKIKKPAEAEKYKLEKLAEAERWVMERVRLFVF